MPFPDGAPLDQVFGDQSPASLRDIVDRFTTDGVTSTPFAGGTQHRGTLKSLQTDPIDLGFGELEVPGITAGTPFRLAIFDAPSGHWHLDIVLNGLSLKLRDLHGADFIKEAGTTPRRLIRKTTDTAVVISGEATIRFQKDSDNEPVVILFVDNSTATDPLANSGAVVSLRCSPPHFFLGTSEFGMTLTELLFDASDSYSPQFIQNLGQPAEWKGFAIAEATFYTPPNALGRGGFSGGVRNLLIGSPRGLQGEFEVQWGRAPLAPETFFFTQSGHAAVGATGSGKSRMVAITASQDEQVAMSVSLQASEPPEGGAVTDWSATWRWPNGDETKGDVSVGQIGHGQILRVTPEEHIAGRPVVRHPEISFRFVASGEIPEIDVSAAGTSVVNAIHVSGPVADIAALAFRARSTAPTTGTFSWKLGDGPEQTGVGITLPLAEITGDKYLILKEADAGGRKRQARLRVQVLEGQALLVGGEDGVMDATAPTTPLTPAAVEGTYDLPDFHAQGRYRPAAETAELDPTASEKVDVPDGTLAIVTIESGAAPPVAEYDRHVEILFEFATGKALRWGADRPVAVSAGGSETDLQRQLLQWAANYPGADFLIVGRCDDLGSDSLNATLAHTRRDTVLRLLSTVPAGSSLSPIDASRITHWGEQDGQPGAVTTSPLDDEEKAAQRLILATDDVTSDPLTDRTGWPTTRQTNHASEAVRETFRRVDIFAVGGAPAAAAVRRTLDPGRAPDLRRMLMPGETVDPVPAVTSTPAMDYRVKLLVGWDKPTGDGWKDLIPSKAEFEFAWSPQDHPLPTLGGDPVTMEVLTVYGSWRHDDATGFTRSQLGIRSDGDPEGLFKVDQANLVAAMALGPVLLSGVNSQTDTIEKAGRITALAAASAFAQVDLGGGPLLGAGSKAIIKSIEANGEVRDIADPGEGYKVSLVSDYSTVLHVNTGRLGLSTDTDHPVKFRFKKVGIHFDSTKTDFWDKIGVAYPTDALEIEDPGKWKIDGVLGELLRAVETALGTGSLWVETRFAFALSIGVVEISEAVIRVTFTGGPLPEFSLRGLVAKIDIPSTVKGEGRLRIEDPGGVIKAGVDLEIIPLKLKASAAFAMASFTTPEPYTFVNLFAKVQFPVGIPLASSGAALYGFIGQTVINGARDLIDSPDIVKREIGWWMKNPEDKYKPLNKQHALGLGAVVGTLPDASFSMSAQGMIVVAFPDVEVIFGVEVKLLQVPDKGAKEKGGDQNASIIGLIVIDDTAVSLAVAASYEIPKILKVKAPFSAYFPYSGHGVYVRIGSDGQMGRTGEPVTLTLLPSTLKLQASSYLMIEQDGLPNLGGRPDFSFDGFSIGFGAGAGLEWKAGPIKLSASVLLLAGFGTDPLLIKAGIFVKGELDLVVISVSARGEIVLTYQNDRIRLDGEFCGKVDFFFFSVEGCVKFRIGSQSAINIAPPPAPVVSVALTDRGGRIMGEARKGSAALKALPIFQMSVVNGETHNTGADPKDNNTVWADTAPVINFRHFIQDAIPNGMQFNPAEQPSGAKWFGSNRLKYAYKLNDVRLIRVSDGALVAGANSLKSVWVSSPARQPGSGGPVLPSGAEVQSLKLLDWVPWGWALPMTDGGASQPGDPAITVGNLCEPMPEPARACLFGKDARGAGVDRIRLLHEIPPPGPYPSRFTLLGRPALHLGANIIEGPTLASLVASAGGLIAPGVVNDLPQTVAEPIGRLTRGYRLPEVQIAANGAVNRTALPWFAELDRTVRRGRLLLMVCDGRSRSGDGEPRSCYAFEGLSIGKSFTALDTPHYRLEAVNAQHMFKVTDDVDLAQGAAMLGADRNPDILIAAPGLIIRPLTPPRALDLYFFRTEALATSITWVDAAGKSYRFIEPGDSKGAVTVRLEADAGIKEIRITPRAKALYLYRICTVGSDQAQACFDFAGVKPEAVSQGVFSHQDVTFTTIDPNIGPRLTDWIDTSVVPAKRGADGKSELAFPSKGVELKPSTPWASVSIGVFSGAGPVLAVAFDAGGNVVAHDRNDAKNPVELHLAAPGIVRVIVSGGNNEAVIFRVCHGGATSTDACYDFRGLKEGRDEKYALSGVTFTSVKAGEPVSVRDVATDSDQIVAQPDGKLEMLIPKSGLAVTPDQPRSRIKLFVMTLGGDKAEAIAFDAAGAKIATARGGGDSDALSEIVLEGEGIARVELHAGGKSFLTRFCTDGGSKYGREGDQAGGLPAVVTRVGGKPQTWVPTVVQTISAADGVACRIVRYAQPANVVDASEFDITTPAGNRVTLLSLCAVDTAADLAQDQDQAAQDDLKDDVTEAATGDAVSVAREVLLDPGHEYRIEVDWDWQSWVSNEEGTDSPPATPPNSWTQGATQTFRFKVAAETLTGGETQDGLNEYMFDPRDISRYLDRTEPADGRDVVFTDDPLWVHFNSGHVENLVDRYGRELTLVVRRTDPPPQPDEASMEIAVWPELIEIIRAKGPRSTQFPVEQRVNDAVAEAPCLPDGPAVGGGSLGAVFKLEKHAMYDFNLVAKKKGEADPALANPVVVNDTRFVTSRYATPAEMLASLGFDTATKAPLAPQEMILTDAMRLPSGALSISDLDMEAALAAIGADTLPPPGAVGRVIALWKHLCGGVFGVAGVLVDAPEPMRRERAVLQGQQAVDSVRCEPEHLSIGGTTFLPVRATLSWTRVLFVAAAPVTPASEAELQFRLKVAPGGSIIGRRIINPRPVMLDTEGF
jgi:hypothetical protein